MAKDDHLNTGNLFEKYMVWFFAGGETRDDRFNIFTGSFIRFMKLIFEEKFDLIRGIYFKSPAMNVLWALTHAQNKIRNPENVRITESAINQIISSGVGPDTQVIITSSSSGSVIAAQTACYLAEKNMNRVYFQRPFHLILGASMISSKSNLYRKLLYYQKNGIIGTIIYSEVQDEGDNSSGIAGLSRLEALSNAFGLIFPYFSRKFNGPSFLNTDPMKGHIHRRRSKTVQKAIDYINVILIKNNLAGPYYREKAISLLEEEKKKLLKK